MFKKILVPTDGSDLSQKAVDLALQFAKEVGAELVALSVAEPYPIMVPSGGGLVPETTYLSADLQRIYDEQSLNSAKDTVKKIAETATKMGVACQTVTAISTNPYKEIIHAIETYKCDLICMASHGRKGISQLFVGSETQKVLGNTKIPVLVVR